MSGVSQTEASALSRLDLESIVADTAELIRARGENPGETEAATVEVLTSLCERAGAQVTLTEVAPGRHNLLAELGGGDGPALLFLGHSDVVPAGVGWLGDPFEPRLIDGMLIGRGAVDMKGGLAAVVAAMSAVHAERPEVRLALLCTVDEEDTATGALRYIADAPTAVAVSDDEEIAPYSACIVAEPTGLDTVVACRGATNFIITLRGAAAHAGNPADGASAIAAAAIAVQAIEDDARRIAQQSAAIPGLIGTGSWNVGMIAGGHGTSIVAEECTLYVDRRVLPDEEPERILEDVLTRIRAAIAGSGMLNSERITVTGHLDMAMPGFLTPPDSVVPAAAVQAVSDAGGSSSIGGWSAACEGGFIARHHEIPVVILGPGDVKSQAHQPEERVRTDELLVAARAYALIALRLAEASR
ncbi:M20 family metallopeptidase [Pseudoclavibacter sp. VKM Ac-2867]|uniref:M20 family metallopeptidase n=1 Tax=Pseudoclavibacter sp. VKM Ac-2867 TaxID=2783829 RepID=UPI00188C3B18|nr:M20/M25/M40 family metallo-hydrolase [Pseudoclavibacter sp. VKM Ac-2867]MBF4460722.1 M20/M25/M40 family metallo-hydrolase [Pseudoclavibacter sp. VKM Ac-2867]